jgi:hypothetical protein
MRRSENDRWRAAIARSADFDAVTLLLIGTLIAVALLTFGDYGISNDEEVQHRYGELIVAYYRSGFSDETLFRFKNLYLYGGLFDIVAVLLERILPFDTYAIRHVMSALFGIGGIAATALTARLIAGPRCGAFAGMMLAICGVWYGAMFNHTKDIPFAAAMIGSAYFLLRALRDLPQPRWRDVLGFGLLLGLSLGLRAIALLMVGYLLLAVLAEAFVQRDNWRTRGSFALASLGRFLPALALVYVIMIAAWPWAALDPRNPVRAIFAFAHFHYSIRTIIAGEIYEMADVPWWYVPAYLAIKVPLVVLLGAAAGAAWAVRRVWSARSGSTRQERETLYLVFFALFPLVCEALAEGPAFTGMRHFLFVLPAFAVLAAVGAEAALAWLGARDRFVSAAATATLAAVLAWPAVTLARLHPYEHLDYNAFVGGIAGAERRYVMDYWANVMPEAVRVLKSYLAQGAQGTGSAGQTYSVATCSEAISFERLPHDGLRLSASWHDADFFIAPTHMSCDHALDGKVIARIERLGALIGVVKDRRAITRPDIARYP